MLSLPNLLTTFRLLLIPAVAWLFMHDNQIWSLIVFLLACVTDVLDGYIARRCNMVTYFGKLLDPLADKLMLIAVLICLYMDQKVPLWMLCIVSAKELAMLFGAVVLLEKGSVVSANIIGKATTAMFMLAIVSAFLFEAGFWATKLLLYLALGLTFASVIKYGVNAVGILKKTSGS